MKLYRSPMLPCHWIVDDGARLWMVPAMAGGWGKRQPYRSTLDGCEEVKSIWAMGCEIPFERSAVTNT